MDQKTKTLEALKKKQEQIKAKIQRLESAEKTRERKKDTRRKILIGAYYLEQAIERNTFHEIRQLMDGYLDRNSDRLLFNLKPHSSEPKVAEQLLETSET